ncbi:MAG: hypothetical protein R2771_04330 [Saprospiraceae bacterium]
MTSATGCDVEMKTNVIKYEPSASFDSEMLDCQSNTVKFINLSVPIMEDLNICGILMTEIHLIAQILNIALKLQACIMSL